MLERILYLIVPLFQYSMTPGSLRQAAAFKPIHAPFERDVGLVTDKEQPTGSKNT